MDENEVDITLFELLLSSADTKSKIFSAAHNPRDEAQDKGDQEAEKGHSQETAEPNWLKRYSMAYNIMMINKISGSWLQGCQPRD